MNGTGEPTAGGTLRRTVRAVGALTILLFTVVGMPLLLAVTAGNPLSEWEALRVGDLTDAVVIDLLAAVAYVAWGQFALAVAAEVIATARRRPSSPRLPGVLLTQQRLAHSLVAAALVALPAAGQAATISTASALDQARTVPVATTPVFLAGAATQGAVAPAESARPLRTVVIGGDVPGTFWDLAERYLGDGQRWKEIWHLNQGRRQSDGTAITSPGLLRPGWTVALPHPPDGATEPVSTSQRHIVVRPGDTLSGIAKTHRVDQGWTQLWNLNRGREQADGQRLIDPDHIEPGWRLTLPDRAAQQLPSPDTRPPSAGSPGPVGQRDAESPPPSGHPLGRGERAPDSKTASPEGNRVATPPPAPPAEETDDAVAERAEAGTDHEGTDIPGGWMSWPLTASLAAVAALVWLTRRRLYRYVEPFGYPDLPGQDHPASPTFATHPDPEPDDEALYRPGARDDDDDDDDGDLVPLPAVTHRIRVLVREHGAAIASSWDPTVPRIDHPAGHAAITPIAARTASGTSPESTEAVPPVGPSGSNLAGLPEPGPAGLALDGPGAHDAARGLLVAALTAGGPADPDAAGQVVTTLDTMNALLGGPASVTLGSLPRLRITPDLNGALSVLDEVILSRRRTLHEHDATDPMRLRDDQPWSAPMPPVLLLANAPPVDDETVQARLTTSLHLGNPLRVHGVLLGPWPLGEAHIVDRAGRVPAAHGRTATRLATLDINAALELLSVIGEAHTGRPSIIANHAPSAGAAARPGPYREAAQPTPPPRSTDASGSPRVQVHVLGKPTILDSKGQPVPGLRAGATQLLVVLAVHRRGHRLMDVMEKIWPDATTRRAADRLSTEAANLRRTVRTALGRTEDRDPEINAVLNSGGTYVLNPDLLDIDLWRLEDNIRAAKATEDAEERITLLRVAIAEHHAPLAHGHDYPWADVARHQIHRDGIRARLHLAQLIADQDPREAARLVNTAADLDPINEDLARRAMRALAVAGDHAAVWARLRALRAALEAIGQEPTEETLLVAAETPHSEDRGQRFGSPQ